MPRRDDIESILLIGSGPIVIGQACEFDYSGTQACKVLREEGYRVILHNSNPATIMTDPEFADATYVEPLDVEHAQRIIEREQPDAVLPTLGGQTALNLAMELFEAGLVGVPGTPEMIGANAEAIATAEDRQRFKDAMVEIGLDVPSSAIAHTLDEAREVVAEIGLPVVIRPAYILGGKGTGIASTPEEFERMARFGLERQPHLRDPHRVLHRGLEGVRARGHARPGRQLRDHLLDREHRPDGRAHRRLDHRRTGPDPLRRRVPGHARRRVRLHPPRRRRDRRLERAVRHRPLQRRHGRHRDEPPGVPVLGAGLEGHRLPHRQDRRQAGRRLHARRDPQRHHQGHPGQLRAGHRLRRHQGAPLGLREVPRPGRRPRHLDAVGGRGHGHRPHVPRVAAEGAALARAGPPRAQLRPRRAPVRRARPRRAARGGQHRHPRPAVPARGVPPSGHDASTRWPTPPRSTRGSSTRCSASSRSASTSSPSASTRSPPARCGGPSGSASATPSSPTCGASPRPRCALAGWPTAWCPRTRPSTPARPSSRPRRRTTTRPGRTPTRSSTPAAHGWSSSARDPTASARASSSTTAACTPASPCRDAGYETVMVNCNPETVSTDYDTSDRLYFEPLTTEDALNVIEAEQASGNLVGVIVGLGGQTPLKLASALPEGTVLGTSPASIDLAEDRDRWNRLCGRLEIPQPAGGTAVDLDRRPADRRAHRLPGAAPAQLRAGRPGHGDRLRRRRPRTGHGGAGRLRLARQGGRPVGRASGARRPLPRGRHRGRRRRHPRPHRRDRHRRRDGARRGGRRALRRLGLLDPAALARRRHRRGHRGLHPPPRRGPRRRRPAQRAVRGQERAGVRDRGQPAGQPHGAVRRQGHRRAAGQGRRPGDGRRHPRRAPSRRPATEPVIPNRRGQGRHVAVKEAVLPFNRFPDADQVLGPEMRSTGEVMGIDRTFGLAFAKSQLAAGERLPDRGTVFFSLADRDKPQGRVAARAFVDLGFQIAATAGTADDFEGPGSRSTTRVAKLLRMATPSRAPVPRPSTCSKRARSTWWSTAHGSRPPRRRRLHPRRGGHQPCAAAHHRVGRRRRRRGHPRAGRPHRPGPLAAGLSCFFVLTSSPGVPARSLPGPVHGAALRWCPMLRAGALRTRQHGS